MDLMKPINISSDKLSPDQPFTAIELGKLWATYLGNSMSNRILSYFLKNVEDEHVKILAMSFYRGRLLNCKGRVIWNKLEFL